MFTLLGLLLGLRTPSSRRPTTRTTVNRRLECEGLENRLVPSLAGPEMNIPTDTLTAQYQSAVAYCRTNDPSQPGYGRSVVVWTTELQPSLLGAIPQEVRAQMFDKNGNKLGGEIVVAESQTPAAQGGHRFNYEPTVGMDNRGYFVVAWTAQADQFGQYAQTDVLAKRFNANGICIGTSNVAVDPNQDEFDPSIAVSGPGTFMVSYTKDSNGDLNVMAYLEYASKVVTSQTIVVANKARSQFESSASCGTDGYVFAVAYDDNDTAIRLARYGSAGALLDNQLIDVTVTLASDGRFYHVMAPNVSTDNNGNCLVVWEHEYAVPHSSATQSDVMARRVKLDGSAGAIVNLTNGSAASERNPVVALDTLKGAYVVAYQVGGDIGVTLKGSQVVAYQVGGNIGVTEVSASDVITASYTIGGTDHFQRQQPAIAIGGNRQYTVTYTVTQDYGVISIFGPVDPGGGIFGKRGSLV